MAGTETPPQRPASHQGVPPPAETRPWWRDISLRVKVAVGGLVVVVGLLSQVTGLIDWVGKKTAHHTNTAHHTKPLPPNVDGTLSKAKLDGVRVPLGDYLKRAGFKPRGYTEDELAEPGLVFTLHIALVGRPGETVPLRWTVYRGVYPTGTVLAGRIYRDQVANVFRASRPGKDQRDWPVWVPYPSRPGTYYVRFRITDRRGTELNSTTAAFKLRRGEIPPA